jgi:hypothetical protein
MVHYRRERYAEITTLEMVSNCALVCLFETQQFLVIIKYIHIATIKFRFALKSNDIPS